MRIAFVGDRGCGKTTAAKRLVATRGFKRFRFSDGFKAMLRALGLTDEQLDAGDKGAPCIALCGKSIRYGMTSLGSGWGRNKIGRYIWTNYTLAQIDAVIARDPTAHIVVDDLRHPDEYAALRRRGFQVWRVERTTRNLSIFSRWLARRGWHKTLTDFDTYWDLFPVDRIVHNHSTLNKFLIQIEHEIHRVGVYSVGH